MFIRGNSVNSNTVNPFIQSIHEANSANDCTQLNEKYKKLPSAEREALLKEDCSENTALCQAVEKSHFLLAITLINDGAHSHAKKLEATGCAVLRNLITNFKKHTLKIDILKDKNEKLRNWHQVIIIKILFNNAMIISESSSVLPINQRYELYLSADISDLFLKVITYTNPSNKSLNTKKRKINDSETDPLNIFLRYTKTSIHNVSFFTFAVQHGFYTEVKQLLERGVHADQEDQLGQVPMDYLVCHGQVNEDKIETTRLLISKNVSFSVKDLFNSDIDQYLEIRKQGKIIARLNAIAPPLFMNRQNDIHSALSNFSDSDPEESYQDVISQKPEESEAQKNLKTRLSIIPERLKHSRYGRLVMETSYSQILENILYMRDIYIRFLKEDHLNAGVALINILYRELPKFPSVLLTMIGEYAHEGVNFNKKPT